MFDQAVRQPMILEDSAHESALECQRDEGEALVCLIPHSSQNSLGSEEEEEWIICELDEQPDRRVLMAKKSGGGHVIAGELLPARNYL